MISLRLSQKQETAKVFKGFERVFKKFKNWAYWADKADWADWADRDIEQTFKKYLKN